MAQPSALIRIAFVSLFIGATAHAQTAQPVASTPPKPIRATIVRIDGEDVYLDVSREGLGSVESLTVYRTITVRHPVTRKSLEDRFAIGQVSVQQAGGTLSLVHASAPPNHPFALGDVVEAEAASSAAPSTASTVVTPAPAAVASDNSAAVATGGTANLACDAKCLEDREVVRYWQATLSRAPVDRTRVYAAFQARYPKSRYRPFVDQELRYLAFLEQLVAVNARTRADGEARAKLASAVELVAPREAEPGQALELAVLVRPDANVRSLVLHSRHRGSAGYTSSVMVSDGRGHAFARIEARELVAPGAELFIEAVDAEGHSEHAFASAESPHRVQVRAVLNAPTDNGPAMRVRFSSEVASFDGKSGRDAFLINEGDFLYRVRLESLYGVRMGYGNFIGQGGSVDDLDVKKLEPKAAGFSYGFLETELNVTPIIGLALRATVGLGRPDLSDTQHDALTGGFQTRLRIGEPSATHLVIAGELMPEIGQRAFIGLGWEAIKNMPMLAEVHVTDQPVNSNELAVRLVFELGYRFSERFALAVRPSYQLRTIDHAGPGMGLSATFDW